MVLTPPLRGRRLVVRSLLSLVPGAAITAAIAAGLAVWSPAAVRVESPVSAWPAGTPSDWPPVKYKALSKGPGVQEISWETAKVLVTGRKYPNVKHPPPQQYSFISQCSLTARDSGWPWYAATCTVLYEAGTIRSDGWMLAPRRLGSGPPRYPVIPAHVLPLGFALDTPLYAVVALGLWSAPGEIIRRRRRVRGHCRTCNYDLSGLPPGAPCPECAAKT